MEFLSYSLLFTIPQLLLTQLFKVCHSPDQTASHRVLGLQVGDFKSDPARRWLLRNVVKFFKREKVTEKKNKETKLCSLIQTVQDLIEGLVKKRTRYFPTIL
jgi:hypothetical protein